MKFGKEFASQMVPEWQEAYMDYAYLKEVLKEIQRFKQRTNRHPPGAPAGLKRALTLYRAFSGLSHRRHPPASPTTPDFEIESMAILVNSVRRDGREGYETMFLKASEEGGEYELVYFRRLDDEFNKVLRFYKSKVEEVEQEAAVLDKQMAALIAFRIKVDNPQRWFDSSVEMTRLASEVAASTASLSATTPSGARATRRVHMDVIDEEEGSSRGEQSDESQAASQNAREQRRNNIVVDRPAPLEILNHVKINKPIDTPRSTIRSFLTAPDDQKEIRFNRENLNRVEQQLKRAFIEFYHKLRLLKSYSFLNMLAFSKIMKKYDKISSRNASRSYLKMVDNSYLGSNDAATKLMDRVEDTFIKHFSNSNRRKGMSILRTKVKRERHRVTFSLGFFVGCTVALVVALILITRARHLLHHRNRDQYMKTMFPLYSLFGFITLHMALHAANIYFWRCYRVNHPFIFGFKEGTDLDYREVFLLSFAIAVLAIAAALANLDMEMDRKTQDYKAVTELVPLGLLCVTLPDFFLADQLTSQVQAFRNLEFYICYYGWGDYRHRENTCKGNNAFKIFYYIIAAVPYWSRLLQCLRRWYEERDAMQGLNGLKYFSTIVAVCLRTAYNFNKGTGWRILAAIASIFAAIFSTYWDLVIDWGLLQKHSKNRWLRDKLLVPYKSVYFVAMALNVALRFAWLQTVLNFQVSFAHTETVVAVVAILEIIRRGIWNFFRLENEHLHNVGKYRAFKSVPLPFNYEEDEDKDE